MKKKVKKKSVKKKTSRVKKRKRVIKKKTVQKARKRKKKISRKKKASIKTKRTISAPSVPAGVSLEEIGEVTHYFPKVEAAVVKLTKGTLSLGDKIIIKGHTTDFQETVNSMQLNHVPITSASVGQEIGLKVKSKVREHDVVYKLAG